MNNSDLETSNQLAQLLKILMEISQSRNYAYGLSVEIVKESEVKTALQKYELQHLKFYNELQLHSRSFLKRPEQKLLSPKNEIVDQGTASVISVCERGEIAALEVYFKILKKSNHFLPSAIKEIIEHQYESMLATKDHLLDLSKAYKNLL